MSRSPSPAPQQWKMSTARGREATIVIPCPRERQKKRPAPSAGNPPDPTPVLPYAPRPHRVGLQPRPWQFPQLRAHPMATLGDVSPPSSPVLLHVHPVGPRLPEPGRPGDYRWWLYVWALRAAASSPQSTAQHTIKILAPPPSRTHSLGRSPGTRVSGPGPASAQSSVASQPVAQ